MQYNFKVILQHKWREAMANYNFIPKEDSDLSFKEAAKIVNKKYQNAFKYLKEH